MTKSLKSQHGAVAYCYSDEAETDATLAPLYGPCVYYRELATALRKATICLLVLADPPTNYSI